MQRWNWILCSISRRPKPAKVRIPLAWINLNEFYLLSVWSTHNHKIQNARISVHKGLIAFLTYILIEKVNFSSLPLSHMDTPGSFRYWLTPPRPYFCAFFCAITVGQQSWPRTWYTVKHKFLLHDSALLAIAALLSLSELFFFQNGLFSYWTRQDVGTAHCLLIKNVWNWAQAWWQQVPTHLERSSGRCTCTL